MTTHTDDTLAIEDFLEPLSILFGKKVSKFPGMLPVSVDKTNMATLDEGTVSGLKADGERGFVYICDNELAFLRRNLQYMVIDIGTTFTDSFIFDGEFLEETNTILLYDNILFRNRPAWRLDYLQRVELLYRFICVDTPAAERHLYDGTLIKGVTLLPTAFTHGMTWRTKSGLQLQVKPIYDKNDAALLWDARHQLPYNCDGIIFTRLAATYVPAGGSNSACVFKWKPCVTIDVEVHALTDVLLRRSDSLIPCAFAKYTMLQQPDKVDDEVNDTKTLHNVVLCSAYNTGIVPLATTSLSVEMMIGLEGQICEFAWDTKLETWSFQKLRLDKIAPNTLATAISCFKSIQDDIDIHDICVATPIQQPITLAQNTNKRKHVSILPTNKKPTIC